MMDSDSRGRNCKCGLPLAKSLYSLSDLSVRKSCSYCSKIAGEHVFHPLREFGLWHAYKDAPSSPQSECVAAYRARCEDDRKFWPAGETCGQLDGTARPATDAAVAEALEPLREEADAALAANRLVGRRVHQDGPRAREPRLMSSPNYTQQEMHLHGAYSFSCPLSDQVAEDRKQKPPAKPTVFRRRAGAVTSAQGAA